MAAADVAIENEADAILNSDIRSVLVTFVTKQEQFALPGASVAIPENSSISDLNDIVGSILKQGNEEREIPPFEFVVEGELIVKTLKDRLHKARISSEKCVEIEFFERYPPPSPQDSLQHDDWVASVHSSGEWLLTGCYDNTIVIWNTKTLKDGRNHRNNSHSPLTIPAHKAPVKAVIWLEPSGEERTFISGSVDQSAIIWKWYSEKSSVECLCECKGHTQTLSCIAVDQTKRKFITGSWDTSVKLWSTDIPADDSSQEMQRKKHRQQRAKIKTPALTLVGHSECVSSAAWMSETSAVTSSWDHSMRIWDMEVGGMASQIIGNAAFFAVSWSPLKQAVLASTADRYIRLYDPRSLEGALIKQKFVSHTKWVSSVCWSQTRDYLFVSGGFDNLIKLWDIRSPLMPIYDLTGHDDKVFSVDWSSDSISSGSADCTAKIFSAPQ